MCFTATSNGRRAAARCGFTLVELLLAVAILVMVTTVAAMTLFVAAKTWNRGSAMTEGLHHGDYVMEQLVMGLRSAYYPDTGRVVRRPSRVRDGADGTPAAAAVDRDSQYGFYHEDNGDGPTARDRISWVKIGGALVGGQRYAETPHRVEFTVQDGSGKYDAVPQAVVRAWQAALLDDAFDPDDVEPVVLSSHVVGFDCVASSVYDEETGEIDWEEEWEHTNSIPLFVRISLYVQGPSEDEPIELTRLLELPCGPLAPNEQKK